MGNRRDNAMAVASAADHQEVLKSLVVRNRRSVVATLVPVATNPQDPDAVAVVIEDDRVGYLPAEVAAQYGPMLRSRTVPITCAAQLHGGEWDMPLVHVILDFAPVYSASRPAEAV
jgi:hypothetical protein